MPLLRRHLGILSGVPFAVCYGVLARIAFGSENSSDFLIAPLSAVFLVLVPIAVGALAVWLTPDDRRTRWWPALGIALIACALAILITGLLAIEALICIAMATPILLLSAAIGGLIACAIVRKRTRDRTTIIGLLLAPFLLAPIEARIPISDSYGTVETRIMIAADPATIWRTLIDVPQITPEERRYSLLFDVLGVPRPIKATLDTPGQGGMRRGWFEHNLTFDERIVDWQPQQRIGWAITIGNQSNIPAPWNEIGGHSFAVTGASYWIEPLGNNQVLLHLDSTYRLSTHFNGYGANWANWGMGEFQHEVLRIIKARAEAHMP